MECAHHLIEFFLVLVEVTDVLDKARLDVIVEEELGEDDKLATEKLEGEIDGGVGDAHAMSTDAVGNVADVDGVEVLVVARLLHKDLVVQVVVVP